MRSWPSHLRFGNQNRFKMAALTKKRVELRGSVGSDLAVRLRVSSRTRANVAPTICLISSTSLARCSIASARSLRPP